MRPASMFSSAVSAVDGASAREGLKLRQRAGGIGRRELLLGGAAAGVGALAVGVPGAQAQTQRSQGPGGIEWLDYDPPRPFAVGARVGNVVYLSGVGGSGTDITAQSEAAFQTIQASLTAFGSDLQYIFKMTVYFVNIADQPSFGEVRARHLPRPIPSTAVAITRLVPPDGLVEIDVMALIPNA
jgi:2-iminobutanoate/2-iminopropanoate deaminase